MGDVSPVLVICQIPGEAIRMPTKAFHRWTENTSTVRHLIGRYAQALLGGVAQTAACNKLHTMEQRCARWLLMTHDRAKGDSFPMTQDFLAGMLGVRRASVTEAALDLQDRGLIKYSRGHMEILDRPGLEAMACECYETELHQRELIMGPTRPPLRRT
jgi:CRP-like cAMP-binding protein